ncbi:MAG: hypothetical protein FWG02_06865 [Holophagaceae bacterium]|nr:hypothetical protein [Holophagaceae bacterium]
MTAITLSTEELPKFIKENLNTKSVNVFQTPQSITIVPVTTSQIEYNCPWFGMLSEEKGMSDEQINNRRSDIRG